MFGVLKGGSNMLTFSVNEQITPDKLKKVGKLLSGVNEYNRESLGIAYLNIVENRGKNKDCARTSLNSLHSRRVFNQYADNAKKQDKFLALEDEVNIRSFDEDLSYSFEDDLIRELDTDYLVKEFLDLRVKIWLEGGYDIFRLLELVYEGDRQACIKIYEVFKDFKVLDFLTEIIINKKVYPKLRKMMRN